MRPAWSEHGPDGIPLGRALLIPPGIVNDDLRQAVAIIGRIHGDGELPPIPMRIAHLGGGTGEFRDRRGQFLIDEGAGLPIAILVEGRFSHRLFAAIHEIGHLLDLCGIGQVDRFASSSDPMLDEWRHLTLHSRAIRQLVEMGQTLLDPANRQFVAYLLDPVEAWARSYTQYVVRRSGDSALVTLLDAFRTRSENAVYYPIYWDEDDFDPIDDAIERLFRRLGWRRTQTR